MAIPRTSGSAVSKTDAVTPALSYKKKNEKPSQKKKKKLWSFSKTYCTRNNGPRVRGRPDGKSEKIIIYGGACVSIIIIQGLRGRPTAKSQQYTHGGPCEPDTPDIVNTVCRMDYRECVPIYTYCIYAYRYNAI